MQSKAVQSGRRVLIYGGGIGGAQLAKRLTGRAQVVLVDPHDYFEVPMAVPRNLVQPEFAERAILPFAQVLPGVEHVRARLTELRPEGGVVESADGTQFTLSGDISVLATGSRFANAVVRDPQGSAVERQAFYVQFRERVQASRSLLIVGGGPVGVEVAGEISVTWPDKSITLIEAGARLLAGTSPAAAAHAQMVLSARGVTLLTGDRLVGQDSASTDVFAPGGVARTAAGRQISYDLLIWCVGGQPNTGYLHARFGDVLTPARRVRVAPDLRVIGQERLFAIGDITDLAENKMAWFTNDHVAVVAANIAALLGNDGARLRTYTPRTGNPMMAVTLGPQAGVTHLPAPIGVIRASWINRKIKAAHMLVPKYRKIFGV